MLPVDGPIVASRSVDSEAWAHVLAGMDMPLVIAPASERGWFGGRQVVAWAPVFSAEGVALDEAAAMLERSLAVDTPCLTAALPPEAPLVRDVRSDVTAALYRAGVRSVIEAIHAGDVYVMNLTRRIALTLWCYMMPVMRK